MRAVLLRDSHAPTALGVGDAPVPQPGAGEVRVRVHAAAVTPTELAWMPTSTTREGAPRPLPVIPGHELSGVVEAVAAGAAGLAIGDAVFGMNDWFGDGAQAERCLARALDLAAKPRTVDHVAAATLPISALTAWQGLFDRGRLAAGQRVLIHGGAGGVGLCAVQLARWRRARVVATASAANLDFVRGLGADEVIDYRATRFEDAVRDVDVVFDAVGGETLSRSWAVLRPGGTLVTVAAAGAQADDPRVRDAFFIVEPRRDQLEAIACLVDSGALRPVVGAVFPLAEARAAYAHKPGHGKVVLRVAA